MRSCGKTTAHACLLPGDHTKCLGLVGNIVLWKYCRLVVQLKTPSYPIVCLVKAALCRSIGPVFKSTAVGDLRQLSIVLIRWTLSIVYPEKVVCYWISCKVLKAIFGLIKKVCPVRAFYFGSNLVSFIYWVSILRYILVSKTSCAFSSIGAGDVSISPWVLKPILLRTSFLATVIDWAQKMPQGDSVFMHTFQNSLIPTSITKTSRIVRCVLAPNMLFFFNYKATVPLD